MFINQTTKKVVIGFMVVTIIVVASAYLFVRFYPKKTTTDTGGQIQKTLTSEEQKLKTLEEMSQNSSGVTYDQKLDMLQKSSQIKNAATTSVEDKFKLLESMSKK